MSTYDPDKHHRRSIRLKDYDYSSAGAYFVTLCTEERACLFGEIHENEMILSSAGHIVAGRWLWLAEKYSYVILDQWVVMPNHLHGIVVIDNEDRDSSHEGGSRTAPTDRKPLGRLIGAFKTVSTKHINELRGTPAVTLWQRDYYEHVVRGPEELTRIRQYIEDNPARWLEDDEYRVVGAVREPPRVACGGGRQVTIRRDGYNISH